MDRSIHSLPPTFSVGDHRTCKNSNMKVFFKIEVIEVILSDDAGDYKTRILSEQNNSLEMESSHILLSKSSFTGKSAVKRH